MSSIIESPGIPLVGVGMNGRHYQKYKTLGESTDSQSGMSRKKWETVGIRLARRKQLFASRRRASDVSLAFAIVGILIMVLENELTAADIINRSEMMSYFVKMLITASTVTLLIFLGIFHCLDIQLFVVNNSCDDWKIAMNSRRVIQIIVEIIVCIVHPIPGNFDITWPATVAEGQSPREFTVPLDVILSLPMFLRLYLVCRTIMLHSKLYQDASSQSLGALNRIHFNFRFIFKSLMAIHSDYVLLVMMMALLLVASWTLRLCEMHDPEKPSHADFLNSMWLIAITFLSVGYGDIVPSTYCGRLIAVMTGIMGAGFTALVVAVLARKLELSRAEKCVHDFVIDVDLDKRLKHEAANVLKAGWFIYKLKKQNQKHPLSLVYQRKLLGAIYAIREIKAAQRRLMDASLTMVELNKAQIETSHSVDIIKQKQITLDEKVDNLETKIIAIHDKLNAIHKAVKHGGRDAS